VSAQERTIRRGGPFLWALGLWLALGRAGAAEERLVLLGGGERSPEALARFVSWAGNGQSRLLVVTWASPDATAAFDSLGRELALYHPEEVRAAPEAPLAAAARSTFLAQLRQATGVFFAGGDQRRIMDVLADAELRNAVRARYHDGVVFAGSSAGTAVMSGLVITDPGAATALDGSKVSVRTGLALLPGVILDQHFIKRQRANRLLGLVLDHPALLGLGVDEDTALVVRDNRHAEVVGRSEVVTVDAQGDGELRLIVLRPGDTFDLKTRRRGPGARATADPISGP
jgi:cyanophycinase